MPVTVRVPSPLRKLTDGVAQVEVQASDVRSVISELEQRHPGFEERLLDEEGQLRRFVNLYVSDEDVRFREGLDTPVSDGETVSIVPAVAGG